MPAATHCALFWFRRDLRLDDNAGLHAALASAGRVYCVFVFDREILDALADRRDRRVDFILQSLLELDAALRRHGSALIVLHDVARTAIPMLAAKLAVDAVFANGDYEPQAVQRDAAVAQALAAAGRKLHLAKDQAIFEKAEVLTLAGRPFTVFTPYRNAWLRKFEPFYVEPFDMAKHANRLSKPVAVPPLPTLASLGFEPTEIGQSPMGAGSSSAHRLLDDFESRIGQYREARNIPSTRGTSLLSVHNRFGTVSVRELARRALRHDNEGARLWLSEIAWRDFFFQILWHHPRVATEAFRAEYAQLEWVNDPALFAAWCEGRTGYPLVDAAMRQLETTGFMHNRLRMVVASFLCKDLLVDWRLGERYFAAKLNDYDLAANNGGWQWAASTGCDAQPYFRIFNPISQSEKFDGEGRFIRALVPVLARVPNAYVHAPWTMPPLVQQEAGCVIGRDYPHPVVDHAMQREKALALYGRARAKG